MNKSSALYIEYLLRRQARSATSIFIDEVSFHKNSNEATRGLDTGRFTRADLVEITRDKKIIVYEIKTNRADFLSDIRKRDKHKGALACCNLFFYAAPAGVIVVDELPDYAGLIEPSLNANRTRTKKKAPIIIGSDQLDGLHRIVYRIMSATSNPAFGWATDYDSMANHHRRRAEENRKRKFDYD